MKLGFVSAILPDLSLAGDSRVRGVGGILVRGSHVLASEQGRAALCRRDAH